MKKIIIPLLLLLFLVPSCKFFNRVSKKEAVAIAQARADSLRRADSLQRLEDLMRARELARLDSLRAVEEQNALKSRFKYNIIVGSFVTPEYATDYASEYKAMGYDVEIISMEGTPFNLVAAEKHESFNEAAKRLLQFQDTVSMDAWLYVRP